MINTRKMVLLALFISQALVLSIVEAWIPLPVGVPGVKLGLANIVSLLVIINFGFVEALIVVLIRCVLSSFFGGGISILLFSVTGGLFSTILMSFLHKKLQKTFSIVGISIAGSVAHNVGQIIAAGIYLQNYNVLGYLPVLLISGIVMGLIVGVCTSYFLKATNKLDIWS